ncbi:MAG TPA: hypothetical protein VMX14_13280 [Anaerolineae bacterium]|nr:hypothetical protein [Anaerolineae bacterium]
MANTITIKLTTDEMRHLKELANDEHRDPIAQAHHIVHQHLQLTGHYAHDFNLGPVLGWHIPNRARNYAFHVVSRINERCARRSKPGLSMEDTRIIIDHLQQGFIAGYITAIELAAYTVASLTNQDTSPAYLPEDDPQ